MSAEVSRRRSNQLARRLSGLAVGLLFAASTAACGREATPSARVPIAPSATPVDSAGYRLPVVGTWRVLRTHYGAKNDQAYAVDLVVDLGGGRYNQGSGRLNSDFAAYGQPIVADGAGTVVVVVDGVPENQPGVVNRYDMHGNYVVIDHHNGEFSLMCHFIPGSIRVRPGALVSAGDELGRCGNSGQSTMPHLHWQVMDNPNPSAARGLPPRMRPFIKNGQSSADILQANDIISAE